MTTDSIIHKSSCHPTEHRMLAISYLAHRMNTHPIKNKTDEENMIKQIIIKSVQNKHSTKSVTGVKR